MQTSPRKIRWILTLAIVLMAGLLLGTGLLGYRTARTSVASLVRSQAVTAGFAIRRALRNATPLAPESLREVLSETEDEGVTYIAVLEGKNAVTVFAGVPQPADSWVSLERGMVGPKLEMNRSGFRVRFLAPLWERPGRGLRGEPRGPGMGPLGHGPRMGRPDHRLAIELFSPTAQRIHAQAHLIFIVNSVAAAMLLVLSAVLWRLSRKTEETEAHLARDRQLKTLGRMSAVLGHELRNPLTSLKGHVQLLLEKLPSDHPGRRGAETVLRETMRLEELARHVLEFARTGAVERSLEDPVALAKAAAERVEDPRVQVRVQGEAKPVYIDRPRMESVLTNLLRNAMEASPMDGPITLTVTLQPAVDLIYEIHDRGEGIPEGEEERIFEPFYTRRAKGTGLGLALAKQIVEGHQGNIQAKNHPQGGAIIRITLPWQEKE